MGRSILIFLFLSFLMVGEGRDLKIVLMGIGEIDEKVLIFLKKNLPLYFKGREVIIVKEKMDIPQVCFDEKRRQYLGDCIISKLRKKNLNYEKILGIIDKDLYSNSLNFIFGIATNRETLISLRRLRNEYYGLKKDESLFYQRILKEANHELGHSFGLTHCFNSKCVMYFSNTLGDTDRKRESFCIFCKKKLDEFFRR